MDSWLTILRLSQIGIFIAFATLFSIQSQAQQKCGDIFLEISPERTPITSLESLGKAMSEGMLLNPHQSDIFEVYRSMYYGNPATAVNGQTLKSVTDILQKHPELQKPHFAEYTINTVEKVYQTPETLGNFLKSQTSTAGQVRSSLYQIEANQGFWKKLLDYKDPEMPSEILAMQKQLGKDSNPEDRQIYREKKSEFDAQVKRRFETYLNRIINKTNQKLLAELKDEKQDYQLKAKALFQTLQHINKWMEKNGRNTQPIRQAMVDLVHTIGFGNRATQSLLKSENAMDKVEGLTKLMDERDSLAMDLGYPGHFAELQAKLNIEFPTGLTKNEDIAKSIQNFEQDVSGAPYTTKAADTIRVRSLSIQEAPFRSCLGGSDCSTRTYFSKALDPNYNYFTMTDSQNHSSGHVTVVLGEAQGIKVAFVDKLQNVPNQKINSFLTAVSKSLAEKGYQLALPQNVGDHNGLSNMDTIRHFVQGEIVNRLTQKLSAFVPHTHQYNFPNQYSRADKKLDVVVFEPKTLDQNTEVHKGRTTETYLAEATLDKKQLYQDFLKLKDSNKEEDQIKFIKGVDTFKQLEDLGLYTRRDRSDLLYKITSNPNNSFAARKAAFFEAIIDNGSMYRQLEIFFHPNERKQVNAELMQWKDSNDGRKKEFVSKFPLFQINSVRFGNLSEIELTIRSPFFDVNVKDREGSTSLIYASQGGRKDVVEALLKVPGIDVNMTDAKGSTALMLAAYMRHKEIVAMLLQTPGIDVNKSGAHALTLASNGGSKEIVAMLLKHPDINVNGAPNGATSLMYAAAEGHSAIVEMLLKAPGIDVNAKGSVGLIPLNLAAEKGHKETVELLLKAPGIDVNNRDLKGSTALLRAMYMNQKEVAEILLNVPGIDVNVKDKYGATPLNIAAGKGRKETVEMLLKAPGIDVNAKDDQSRSSLMLAQENGHNEIVDLLKAHGATP